MGGWQQIDKLFRKNLLLKSRRPKATCIEFSVPLVLFAILVFVRKRFDKNVEVLGPFHFDKQPLYPMSDTVLEMAEYDPSEPNNRANFFVQHIICPREPAAWVSDMVMPLLRIDVNGAPLQDQILGSDPDEMASDITDAVQAVQAWNVENIISKIRELRDDYFSSGLAANVAETAGVVGSKLRELQGLSRREAEQHVQQYWNDSCHLQGELFNHWESGAVARVLDDLQQVLHDLGVPEPLGEERRLHHRDTEDGDGYSPTRRRRPLARYGSLESLYDEDPSINALQIAAFADKKLWWMSHFVRSDGLTSMVLDVDKLPEFVESEDGLKPQQLEFATSLGASLYENLWHLQRELDKQELERLNERYGRDRRLSSVSDVAAALFDDINGRSAAEIEHEVLPEWKEDWQESCASVDVQEVADFFGRTHAGCPFYRKAVDSTVSAGVEDKVKQIHDMLHDLDLQALEAEMIKVQDGLKDVDTASLHQSIRRVLQRVQGADAARPPWHRGESEKVAEDVWHAVHAELRDHMMLEGRCEEERRLQEDDSEDSGDETRTILSYINTHRFLVAPYRGEVVRLWKYAMVELVESLTTSASNSGALRFFLRCPYVRATLAEVVEGFINERTLYFGSEEELDRWGQANSNMILLGVIFRSADSDGNFPKDKFDVQYALRMHSFVLPSTSTIISRTDHSMFGGALETSYPYLDFGIAHIQDVLGRAAARLASVRVIDQEWSVQGNVDAKHRTDPIRELAISLQQFPAPQYVFDRFINIIQFMLPFIMILGWIYALSLLAKEIVYEKQERLREVMRIMGLRTWVYWTSWIASAMSQMTVLVTAITILMSGGNVLKHSNPMLVFTYFWLYSLSIVSLAMLISACFNRAKVAAVCAGVIYYVFYLPYTLYPRFEDDLSVGGKLAFCFLSPSAMGIGMSIIAKWELEQDGLQWDNIALAPPVTMSGSLPRDNFSLAHVIMMFIVDCCIYQILAWYIEKVFPGSYGLPQPWYFFLLPSYWCPRFEDEGLYVNPEVENVEEMENASLECWETGPADTPVLVQIRKLAKTFRSGKKALKGITLNMHEGTILALLGHNGAGKSTTMSMLTGLYPPSSGDVLVNGTSVRKDSHKVRKQLGVCLQQNALYESMTVEEHLALFCQLKGVSRSDTAQEVASLLAATGLQPKASAMSRALSGGMKRKLSIGLALAGGSRIVALDEPTAGVDAVSRRDIWHLLAKSKPGRAILLSTHFMDEADVLSDRIAIIAEGELRAIGSSVALKKHFADGYMLTVVAADTTCQQGIATAIGKMVPAVEFAGSRGRELCFLLPAAARASFDKLFCELKDPARRAALGIETYGLSAATMEEVFLQASSMHEDGLHGMVRNKNIGLEAQLTWELGSLGSTKSPQSSAGGSSLDTPSMYGKSSYRHFEETAATVAALDIDLCSNESDKRSVVDVPPLDADQQSVVDIPQDAAIPPDPDLEVATPSNSLASSDNISVEKVTEGNGPWSVQCMSGELEVVDVKPLLRPKMTASKSLELEEDIEKEKAAAGVPVEPKPMLLKTSTHLQGAMLWPQQFLARLCYRCKTTCRDRRAWASQVLLPAIFVLLALLIAQIMEVIESEPPLRLDTDMFIGNAKGSRTSLEEHILPFLDTRADEVGLSWATSFNLGGGEDDVVTHLDSGSAEEEMPEYLMDRHRDLLFRSYGAASLGSAENMPNATLWFKNRAAHAIPAMVNWCNKARFKHIGIDGDVQAWSHPLPKTQDALFRDLTGSTQMMTDLTVSVTVILAMGFIPASFVVHLVHEKSSRGKHQQLLTGVSPVVYWLSSYCWDLINFVLPTLLCYGLFLYFQLKAYSGENSTAVLSLLLAYGACMTPFMYCMEPFFRAPSTAYVTLICMNIFTGTVSVMATTILDMYQSDLPDIKPLNQFCKAIFPWLLPNYNLGRGMIELATNHYGRWLQKEYGTCPSGEGNCDKRPLEWDVCGRFLCYLMIMSVVWFLLRLLIEWRFFVQALGRAAEKNQMMSAKTELEDFSVGEEEHRVADLLESQQRVPLLIHDLHKTWSVATASCGRSKQAIQSVRGISVGVAPGECFGLLGVNGAGKTTTMRMITGDIGVTSGKVLLNGFSISDSRDKARRHLGYCPQFDALPDKLSVRETLLFYARIRGIPPSEVREVVDVMIRRMCLEAHQNQLCQYLSGGNKRKVSTAMALIGEPDVVLLDEPSTGIDVGARRFLWDVLGDIRQSGHSLVLTSHSMDECEVLCTRLTIMVAGQFRCLGTPLQLKDKFGGGYTLCVKAQPVKSNEEDAYIKEPGFKISAFVESAIPGARLLEANVGLYRYRLGGPDCADLQYVKSNDIDLGEVFHTLEKAVSEVGELRGCVSDYTVSQTSLEEVFLHFAHQAQNSEDVCADQVQDAWGLEVASS